VHRNLNIQDIPNTGINPIVKPECLKNVQNFPFLNTKPCLPLEPGALITFFITTIVYIFTNPLFNHSIIISVYYTTILFVINTIEPEIERIVPVDYQTQFHPTENISIKGNDTHEIRSGILKIIFCSDLYLRLSHPHWNRHIQKPAPVFENPRIFQTRESIPL